MTYFDHNATTPLSSVARKAWLEAVEDFQGNPSSPHRIGARAESALGRARERLARFLGCDALDLVWTSGATESNNTILHHFARTHPEEQEVWVSAIEHPCVLAPAQHYFGSRLRRIPVSSEGVIELDWIGDRLRAMRPGFIAVMAANNETGVIQPWESVMAICREREIPFFCDAAQWAGKMPVHGLGQCDWVSGCAHKFGGPKGVGFLKTASQGTLTPLLLGGPQEEGRRAGTENVAAVLAMIAALEDAEGRLARGEQNERREWRDAFERDLLARISGIALVGAGRARLWNTVAALMPQADCQQRWVVKLDKAGCAVSTGSACASGKEKPSHVLSAMGFGPDESSRMLRFSSGWATRPEQWTELAETIEVVHGAIAGDKGSR